MNQLSVKELGRQAARQTPSLAFSSPPVNLDDRHPVVPKASKSKRRLTRSQVLCTSRGQVLCTSTVSRSPLDTKGQASGAAHVCSHETRDKIAIMTDRAMTV